MAKSPDKFHGFLVAEGIVVAGTHAGDDHEYDTAGSYNNMRYYYASEHETKENRPKLTIDFDGDAVILSNAQALQKFSAISGSNYLRVENSSENNYSLRLFDMKGRMIKQLEKVNAMQSVTINTTNFAKGVYTLNAISEKGALSRRIVIK